MVEVVDLDKLKADSKKLKSLKMPKPKTFVEKSILKKQTSTSYKVSAPSFNLEPYRQDKQRFIQEARISERRSLFFDE